MNTPTDAASTACKVLRRDEVAKHAHPASAYARRDVEDAVGYYLNRGGRGKLHRLC